MSIANSVTEEMETALEVVYSAALFYADSHLEGDILVTYGCKNISLSKALSLVRTYLNNLGE